MVSTTRDSLFQLLKIFEASQKPQKLIKLKKKIKKMEREF